ncbi:MAG: MlaA family lipoprotein [Thermodesulfobacteriota bacterium]|nr:MlaA family lipoprotein [Thermodesulfobacteriota bacterium]
MKRQFNLFLIILGIGFLILSGCAHRKADTPVSPSDASTKKPVSPNREISPSEEAKSNLAEKDEFLDEFENEFKEKAVTVADPLSLWNRAMHHFNDKLYFWFLKPVAKGYRAIVPGVVRTGVRNFFSNIFTPIRLTSCVLQGKVNAGGTELVRFAVNSTVGILGFGDPAQKYFNLDISDEDLGQTLGAYGIGNGFYLVWPVLGPSTLRDSVGMVGDRFLNPITYVKPIEASVAIWSFDKINETSLHIGDWESIKEAAIEPYEAFRDAYIQYRNNKVKH